MRIHPLYLKGGWLTTSQHQPVRNPATGEPFAYMSICERPEVAQALAHAEQAWAEWRQLTGQRRGDFLHAVAGELERGQADMARIITLENGKPLRQSESEVALAVDHLRWFAEEARRAYGWVIPHQTEGRRHLVLRTPVGVVAAISPWNFPLALAVRKVAPALAAGCSVVLKPASATPLSAVRFAECVHQAKVPSGVFQLVAGSAPVIGAEFLENPACRKITFTGSTEVGRQLIAGAALQVKPLSLELGGCAPALVFEDAALDEAVEGILLAKFRNMGQSCIAANRLYVQRSVYEPFLERLVARTKALRIGNGCDPGVEIGPLINEAAVRAAEQQVEDALVRGARLLCGGRRIAGRPGYFFEPTVLSEVSESSQCWREEAFAPIAPVCVFDTESEAVARANASRYGLSAYAFTRDLSRALRLMDSIESGMLAINHGLPTTSQCPFGGIKQSGWGRELGREGLDAFLVSKHVSLSL